MRARRIALPILALLLTAFAPGSKSGATTTLAPILPEVTSHLDKAETCLDKKQFANALAHCAVIIVADEIKVAVQYENIPDRQRGSCEKAIDFAFEAWERALNSVTFTRVEDPKDADVTVVFKPSVNLKGEAVAGLLNWKRTISNGSDGNPAGKFRAEMSVRMMTPDLNPMPAGAIRHTVTHEMGHVFGLEDTDHVGELMGPLNLSHPLTGPQDHEAAAVRAVRNQALEIRDEARRLLVVR